MTTPEDTPDIDAPAGTDYNPRYDSEALLLSALLWAGERGNHTAANAVAQTLTVEDFYRPMYAKIFRVLCERAQKRKPCDSASVITALTSRGTKDGMLQRDATEMMMTLIGLQANDLAVTDYAHQVASKSYRRQFHRMVAHLGQIATEAPEDELFARLVEVGKGQRRAWDRYRRLIGGNG